MDVDICNVCGFIAKFKCARCKQVSYCKKECQINDWSTHKLNCLPAKTPESIRNGFAQQANNRIAGNILIMAAHSYKKYGVGVIFAEITETIEEFMQGGSLHFAHLQFVSKNKINKIAPKKFNFHQIDIDKLNLSTETVNVVYCFNNYHYAINIKPKQNLSILIEQHPYPEDIWSIVFEL